MQQTYVFYLLLLWLGLSGTMSLGFTTGSTCTGFYLVWALLFCLPFLLRPLAGAERHLRPAMTVISHRRNRAWVHLAPWQPTTNLTPARVCRFWQSVNASTCQALEKHRTVVISSHLLTAIRTRRLLAYIEENGLTVHSRTYCIPFTPAKRSLMQLEILFRQWRWRTNFRRDWPVLVIQRKYSEPEK
nr:hypothetical protein [Pantoea cypripedii]